MHFWNRKIRICISGAKRVCLFRKNYWLNTWNLSQPFAPEKTAVLGRWHRYHSIQKSMIYFSIAKSRRFFTLLGNSSPCKPGFSVDYHYKLCPLVSGWSSDCWNNHEKASTANSSWNSLLTTSWGALYSQNSKGNSTWQNSGVNPSAFRILWWKIGLFRKWKIGRCARGRGIRTVSIKATFIADRRHHLNLLFLWPLPWSAMTGATRLEH